MLNWLGITDVENDWLNMCARGSATSWMVSFIIIVDMLSCPTLVIDLMLFAVRMTSEGFVGTMNNEFG